MAGRQKNVTDIIMPGTPEAGQLFQTDAANRLVKIPTAGVPDGYVLARNTSSGLYELQAPSGGGGGGSGGGSSLLGNYTGTAVAGINALTRTASGTSGNLFQSDFRKYSLVFHSVVLSATGNVPGWRVSTDAATFISSATYKFQNGYAFNATLSGQRSTTATSILFRDPTGVPAQVANTGWKGEHLLVNPLDTGFHTEMDGHHSVEEATQGMIVMHWCGGYSAVTAVVGIQLVPSNSGTISGSFSVYGLAH